ncbi:MAG TPA: protein-glutamate O-methyltransferase CheR [Pseudolabrys sp.]|jgi:chemotaxis protein methyltransferase CheR
MTPHDFEYLRRLLKERSGLSLSAEKDYLLESRLLPLARRQGMASLAELVMRLRQPGSTALAIAVTEAMTTNETFFFRDRIPYDHLRDTIIPALAAARSREKRIRIWCTAAASGQEPYSIAMMLKAFGPQLHGFRVDILATDLSAEVIDRAKAGVYSQFEVQRGLPINLLVKYFSKSGDRWEIAPELRGMVQFRTLNLLNDFTPLGQFDIVFCRNVLIYFDQATKAGVLDRVARQMAGDGYLTLGAAETVVGLTDCFMPVPDRRGLYMPTAAARRAPSFAGNVIRFAAKA